ncbi:MAG: LysM peptidoglycan-binding domain-containing protein [Proteobacteria bacterium]|nr:LysM peptidoglycan-binding domain-containing protein [Pseudomonadota bacterium]
MKKKNLLVVLICSILCFAFSPYDEHIVQRGESLWKITEKYLNDPYKWVDIWKINPEVKDPHWIYPGRKVRIPSGIGKKEAPQEIKPVEEVKPVIKEIIIWEKDPYYVEVEKENRIKKYVVEVEQFEKMDYYTSKPIISNLTLLRTDENIMLGSTGKKYFVDGGSLQGIELGKKFKVVKSPRVLKDNETGNEYGYIYPVAGIIEITEVYPQISAGYIVESYREINSGDLLAPIEKITFPEIVIKKANVFLEGKIIGISDNHVFVQNRDLVFIDRGSKDGLGKGDILKIEKAIPNVKESLKDVGRMVVVNVFDNVSVAYILEIRDVIEIGARFSTFTDNVGKK